MNWKKPKKSTIQNILFIVFIALLLFSPLGTFVKIQLNRLIAFSPKTIAVMDQKKLSSYQWQLVDASGKHVSLEEYRGKVIFINFWATWCAPCIVEIPWFIEFQKKYGPQGFEVVGISLDETGAKDVAPFVKKRGMNYAVLLGDENVATQFGGILGLPTSFLIDRNGNYYSMHRGLVNKESMEEELQILLGQSAASPETPASPPAAATTEPKKQS